MIVVDLQLAELRIVRNHGSHGWSGGIPLLVQIPPDRLV
jgi:hypothetical protein